MEDDLVGQGQAEDTGDGGEGSQDISFAAALFIGVCGAFGLGRELIVEVDPFCRVDAVDPAFYTPAP